MGLDHIVFEKNTMDVTIYVSVDKKRNFSCTYMEM